MVYGLNWILLPRIICSSTWSVGGMEREWINWREVMCLFGMPFFGLFGDNKMGEFSMIKDRILMRLLKISSLFHSIGLWVDWRLFMASFMSGVGTRESDWGGSGVFVSVWDCFGVRLGLLASGPAEWQGHSWFFCYGVSVCCGWHCL